VKKKILISIMASALNIIFCFIKYAFSAAADPLENDKKKIIMNYIYTTNLQLLFVELIIGVVLLIVLFKIPNSKEKNRTTMGVVIPMLVFIIISFGAMFYFSQNYYYRNL
jgi:glycerol uptake facilitator-like aquaporin